MHLPRRPTRLFALLFLCSLACLRASWTDPELGRAIVQNYSSSDYGLTGFNWVVTTDKRGHVFVGNDQVVEFDGQKWSYVAAGNATQVRALATDSQDRIWLGADNDFGYLEATDNGLREFHSLKALLPPQAKVEHFWGVVCLENSTVFFTNDSVISWNGRQLNLRQFTPKSRVFCQRIHGKALITGISEGPLLFDGERYEPVAWKGLDDQRVGWVAERPDGSALIGAEREIFNLRQGVLEPLQSEAKAFILKNGASGCVRLKDGTVAVALIFGGVIFISDDGTPLRLLDRTTGLACQNATSIHLDSSDNLWIPTTRSVSRVDSLPGESFFDTTNGLDGGMTMRLVAGFEKGLVALSEEGLYYLKRGADWKHRARFEKDPDLNTLIWDAVVGEDGQLLVGGFSRLQAVDKGKASNLRRENPDIKRLLADPRQPGRYLAITDQSLVSFEYQSGNYNSEKTLFRFPETPQDSLIDSRQVVWASTLRRGIYAVSTVSDEVNAVRHFEEGVELPQGLQKARLFRIAGDVYAFDETQVVKLVSGPAEPERDLANWKLIAAQQEGSSSVYAVGQERGGLTGLLELRNEKGRLKALPLVCHNLSSVGKVIGVYRPPNGEALWIAGTEGLLRLSIPMLRAVERPAAPRISGVEWKNATGVMKLPLAAKPELTYSEGSSLTFEVRDPSRPLESDFVIETRILGLDETWRRGGPTVAEANLREGDYTFQARLVSLQEVTSEPASYPFVIRPPWQRSPWAYTLYAAAAAGLAWLLASLRLRQAARRTAELEKLVNERTDALTKATAAKSAFLSNMGHEILNPLNGVVGLVENLKEMEAGEEEKRVIRQISNCASQLVSVVEDVLEYSRIEAGTLTIRMKPFRLSEPVLAAADIFRAVQHRAVAPIEVEIPPELEIQEVYGAPDRIRQVLVNYISNAMKFGQGTPVTVAVHQEPSGMVFRVTDRGPGIPLDEQATLFHRFQRSKAARRSEIPGTGLGLAACKAYAEAMGGEVWLESNPGHGATFFLRVPLRAATPADASPTVITHDSLAGKRVLVLDDHEFNRKVLCDLLARMGARASAAENIPEAKTLFAARPPDLVFIDLDLGHASGFEFARWIRRESPAGRDVPAVATTAFALEEVRRQCEEAGMDGFVAKPVSAWKIRETVARIDQVRGGASAPSRNAGTVVDETDASMLALLAGGDAEALASITKKTHAEIRAELARVTYALRKADIATVSSHAHRLISVTVMAGRPAVIQAGKALHAAARAGDLAESRRLRNELSAAVRREIPKVRSERPKDDRGD